MDYDSVSEDNKHYQLDSGRTCTANGHSGGQGVSLVISLLLEQGSLYFL